MDESVMPKIVCNKCGYVWVPRVADPKKCPRCGCRRDW